MGHAAALESDLTRYYQQDLRDLWRPRGGASRLTWRRLGVLIDGLPGESLTKTAIRDALGDDKLAELASQPHEGHGAWSRTDFRIAALEDAINRLTWRFMQANFRNVPDQPPTPVSRPGIAGKARKRAVLTPEGREYLKYLREHQGALPPGYTMMRAN